MIPAESFKDKTFVVTDPDARVRRDDDMMAFAMTAGGQFRTIPQGSQVRITEIRIAEAGSQRNLIFGRAAAAGHDEVLGWTSTRNLEGKFMNETIGLVPPAPGASRFGPNAAWSNGEFLGQIDLVSIVDSRLDIERLALKTIDAYMALVAAAAGGA